MHLATRQASVPVVFGLVGRVTTHGATFSATGQEPATYFNFSKSVPLGPITFLAGQFSRYIPSCFRRAPINVYAVSASGICTGKFKKTGFAPLITLGRRIFLFPARSLS